MKLAIETDASCVATHYIRIDATHQRVGRAGATRRSGVKPRRPTVYLWSISRFP